METLRFHNNSNPYRMKKILMILLAILCATMAFGQGKFKTIKSIVLYNKSDLNSTKTIVDSGTVINIGAKTGDFLLVPFNDQLQYIHQSELKNCIPDTTSVVKLVPILDPVAKQSTKSDYGNDLISQSDRLNGWHEPTPGDELFSAGKLLLTGTLLPIGGAILGGTILGLFGEPTIAYSIAGGLALAGFVLDIVGYSKLMKAGERFNLGATSSGIGLTIRLNK